MATALSGAKLDGPSARGRTPGATAAPRADASPPSPPRRTERDAGDEMRLTRRAI